MIKNMKRSKNAQSQKPNDHYWTKKLSYFAGTELLDKENDKKNEARIKNDGCIGIVYF